MTGPTRKPFSIAEAFPEGTWYTDVTRFHQIAHRQLNRLVALCDEVIAKWPKAPSEPLKDHEIPEDLNQLTEERDLASDVTRIFAAMATEAFLNFYGAARMGEVEFKTHFERLGVVQKARQRFLLCDGVSLDENDPLIEALRTVAESRNRLLHHKAKKAKADEHPDAYWTPIPGAAREAVAAMDKFFSEVESLLPDTKHFLPI